MVSPHSFRVNIDDSGSSAILGSIKTNIVGMVEDAANF